MINGNRKDEVGQQIKRVKSLASMNKELELWIKEMEEKKKLKETVKESKKRWKPKGKCEICKARDAKFVCIKCNRVVCTSCYFNIVGLCQKCISKDVVEQWKQKNPDWEDIIGIEWID